ncbi:rhamnose transport system ATP-binding protein [Natronincola peptidivorans]|uniref:Rhamnose transport system ATP-binding protein n=1 Tax=Natronincola peptidivorans TaxID=426128 RepID=A0A1I0CGV6_9FIRM|nr:sugar ABC transporter ATP-binding protein [Natronincola peptidivorans]SET18755.1 rhamnose transport system ATP-binding protein [Natronincola peptidivorans]
MSNYVLELNGITKIFPGVKALDNVHFQLKPGEIHALMGENGAGKSTFIKIITGVHSPDEGKMLLNGEEVTFDNPRDAQKLGIAAIYQHVTCYPDLTVTENIFMGHEKVDKTTKRILWKQMHAEAKELLEELGSSIDPRSQMGTLSVAQQQIVEIAKALSTKAKIIIMDEPTAALTNRESEELYRITEKLRDDGASIIFISHRFEDMYRLASKVTVFRDGKYIGTWGINEVSKEDFIVAMVGREVTQLFPKIEAKIGKEILRLEGLGKTGHFADVSFTLHEGEILALTGLVGAGRTEVCQAIFGIMPYNQGKVYVEGQEVTIKSPKDSIQLGIGYLPEDRQQQGLMLQWGIGRNITLPTLEKYSKKGWLLESKEDEVAKTLAEKVNVKANSIFDLASSLSGGNQQKVVVAKLLTADLKIIILDEPTKGVDVGAKAAIYEIMGELASQGYGVVMVSSEMPEVLGMSDKIVVMKEGRVTGILDNKDVTQETILKAAMVNKTTEDVGSL